MLETLEILRVCGLFVSILQVSTFYGVIILAHEAAWLATQTCNLWYIRNHEHELGYRLVHNGRELPLLL